MKANLFVLIMTALSISGCTSITVKPADPAPVLKSVCIQENPKVIIEEFLPVLQQGFQRHGISTVVFSGEKPASCDTVLTYSALRSWDFAPYLSVAELNLTQNNVSIASAEYHLRMKGGFSFMKWQGVKTKMDPVIDELLKNY